MICMQKCVYLNCMRQSVLYMMLLFASSIKMVFFNWDSLHAGINNHYKAWSCKKKKHKKIKAYRKSVYKEPTVKRCLLILEVKPFSL